ncbi:MAG: hypothetical protein KAI66_01110, partial [Lentisphaeria bacterium]|nr:hypothetical protein [Lentisphaeria bacterium]
MDRFPVARQLAEAMARDRQGREEGASTKVVQLLAALPPEERIVLEALSFAYSECSAADLTLCLSGMSRITVGHRVTTLEVRRALRGLEEAGVVEINHYGGAWIDPEIADEVSLKACESKEGVALANAARRALSHTRSRFGTSSSAPLVIAGVRDTRLAYFSQNVQHLRAAASVARQEVDRPGTTLYRLAFSPFSAESFARLAPPFRKAVTESVLPVMASHMLADRGFIPYLLAANLAADSVPALFLSDLLMLHGRFHEAEQLWTDDPTAMTLVREGWTLFLAGDCDGAIVAFDQGLEWMQRQGWYRGDCWYRTVGGVFFVMALLQRGRQEDVKQADRILDRARSTPGWAVAYSALRGVVDMQLGRRDRPRIPEELSGFDTPDRSTRLPVASAAATLALIAVYWQAPEAVARFLPLLHDLRDHAESAGFAWLAIELRALIRRATPGGGETPDEAEQSFRETSGIAPLVDLVRCPSLWELGLDRLETLAGNPLFDSQGAAFRLAWRLGFRRPDDPASFEFIPYEQKRRANGEWTRGRRMRMDALLGEHQPSYLDEHDVRICESAVASGSWSRASKHFEPETLARVLIGHPRVFLAANPSTRIDLSLEAPALRIASRDDGFRVEFGMRGTTESAASVSIVQRTPSRWAVLCADVRQQRLAQVLEDGMTVPREGLERLRGIVHRLAGSVNVESDDEAAIGDVATCEADAIPHVHIVPEGEGLRVEICVYPFGVESTIAQPGSEPRLMLSRQDGELVRTRRDPKDEVERAEAVITACPALDEAGREDWQWIMGDLEQCLELLLQLRDLDPAIPVEWPAGESFRLTSPVSEKGVSLRIRRDRDWFAVSGEVQVDEELTLSFGELLSKARGRVGRFVPLGEGRFLALTDEFRQRLGALEAMGRRVGDDLTVNPFAAEAMEELIENVGAVHADADWSAHILKLGKLRNWTPELPANLEAELRDYQLDGFRWLARLSEWGAGGCLADDMGLGKTVQALAVMLLRADKGPALVVAPTSVVHNWEQEAARFAPTLSVHVFGQGNRTEALAALKPGSLLVCTYGLLQTEIDRLEEVEFATICLDEAQAIKNGMTKRSKAAMRLKG